MCDICFDNFYMLSTKQALKLSKDLNIDGVVNDAISQLFEDGKIDRKTKKQLFLSHNAPLQKAVEEGFGKELAKIEYGTPNYEFLKELQTNTAVFAMFKNHASMKDMAALLKDAEGNLRTKESFKTEALKKDANYRTTKLDAEYDTAVRQARMASQWKKIQENKHLYPNLKYLLTKASKPDEAHLKFVGIIRPIDDIFWQTNYPPNRWRCQCSVEQTDDEATDIPANLPELPNDFKFNAGATGQVFDLKNSDYIKSLPAREQPALIKKAKDLFSYEIAKTLPYHNLYKSKSGGRVDVHPLSFKENDFNQLSQITRSLANEGKSLKMLPSVNEISLRNAILPKSLKDRSRTPDIEEIGTGNLFDIKNVKGKTANTISHAFNAVRGQAENIILNIPDSFPFTRTEVNKMIRAKMKLKEMEGFGQVWVNYKGSWYYNPHKIKRD